MQPSTAILTCLLARLCLPGLLEVAEALNDADFAPLHEGLFIKDPGLGAAVSWHKGIALPGFQFPTRLFAVKRLVFLFLGSLLFSFNSRIRKSHGHSQQEPPLMKRGAPCQLIKT